MDFTEVTIYTSRDGIEALTGALMMVGITGFVIEDAADFEEFLGSTEIYWDYVEESLLEKQKAETRVKIYITKNGQGEEMFSRVKECVERLKEEGGNGFGRLEIEVSGVSEEDWANNWKQYFKPFRVGKKLVVKPSWEDFERAENDIILEIDPLSSFGTGQHATTYMCLELLESGIKGGENVLDLGCGSGILGVAAKLLGAERVCAVDMDENAVKIARENFGKNGIDVDGMAFFVGNILTDSAIRERISQSFDVICANIVADVIISFSCEFRHFLKSDGLLIVSGIIEERGGNVQKALEEQGFSLHQKAEKDGWHAYMLREAPTAVPSADDRPSRPS